MGSTNMKWSFYNIWNQSLENRPERAIAPRSNIWASELGGAYLDRFYKMKGIPATNPPNARSLRKFEAGNLLEWVVEMVLTRAGILVDKQKYISFQYPGLLEVTGKLDHLAGGEVDWGQAKAQVVAFGLPEFFNRATEGIISYLAGKYPQGLAEVILEVKSCSSFMFDRYERLGRGELKHQLQLFHYLKGIDLEEGHLVYICKDDLRMIEFGIFNTPANPTPIEEIYLHDINTMSNYFLRNEEPSPELEILFDEELFRFSKNWKVEYSNYLTKIYEYKEPESYRERWDRKVGQFNRVFGRMVAGKNMTALNKNLIEEMIAYFPNLDELVGKAKAVAKEHPEIIEEEKEVENGKE